MQVKKKTKGQFQPKVAFFPFLKCLFWAILFILLISTQFRVHKSALIFSIFSFIKKNTQCALCYTLVLRVHRKYTTFIHPWPLACKGCWWIIPLSMWPPSCNFPFAVLFQMLQWICEAQNTLQYVYVRCPISHGFEHKVSVMCCHRLLQTSIGLFYLLQYMLAWTNQVASELDLK